MPAYNSETAIIHATRILFNKSDGGSKTITIASAKANPTTTELDNLIGSFKDNATIGGGVTFKNANVDVTNRITYTTA